jgi:hypothetical protein
MPRLVLPFIIASALIFGVFLSQESAAQTSANNIVGTWTLVSVTLEQDGKKTDFYGPNPQGQATYDASPCLTLFGSETAPSRGKNRQSPKILVTMKSDNLSIFGVYI